MINKLAAIVAYNSENVVTLSVKIIWKISHINETKIQQNVFTN